MDDIRINMLAETRRQIEEMHGTPEEREYLLKLLNILTTSIEKYSTLDPQSIDELAHSLVDNRALLAMLKQQGDELDALKKLSINLTSSLDLPDVLDAVVAEAMRLIHNARDVNIFLYKNHRVSFGAALDSDGFVALLRA